MGFMNRLRDAVEKERGRMEEKFDREYADAAKSSAGQTNEQLIQSFKDEQNVARKAAMGNELKNRGYQSKK